MKIVKYEQDNCPFCERAGVFLEQNSIPFETVNISHDPIAKEKVIGLGAMSVPVIALETYDGEVVKFITGFNPGQLSELGEELASQSK